MVGIAWMELQAHRGEAFDGGGVAGMRHVLPLGMKCHAALAVPPPLDASALAQTIRSFVSRLAVRPKDKDRGVSSSDVAPNGHMYGFARGVG